MTGGIDHSCNSKDNGAHIQSELYLCKKIMEQNNGNGGSGGNGSGGGNGGASAQVEAGDNNSQAGAAAMTYANLETLSRLNTEDLTSILSNTNHHRDHGTAHGYDHGDHDSASGQDVEPTGYIVAMTSETTSEAYALAAGQASYVVTTGAHVDGECEGADDGAGVVDDASAETEAANLSEHQLTVHTYCKPNMRVGHVVTTEGVTGTQGTGAEDVEVGQVDASGGGAGSNRNSLTSIGDGSISTRSDLLDLKTVLPGPTTRRVLLIDDGHGDLEMAKSDVEFLLRGDAAGIVLREGKRSEVWSRFGKVTFQGRKVKGYVACIYCRQVYAFGDAHSTGTSTLKKHRCPAQSLVTTASPLTPTAVSLQPSHSPAPPMAQSDTNAYVNFPSPSVIVSIATVRSSIDGTPESGGQSIATRCLSPQERDELVRNAGVILGSGPVAASAFLPLSKALVDLGAKHGSGATLTEDLSAVFKSPLFESLLPSLAYEYRSHFVEEARASAGGIGVALFMSPSTVGELTSVTMKMSYCIANDNPFVRQAPLRHVRLRHDEDLNRNIGELVRRTLRDERLHHLRRAVVCNRPDVLESALCGEIMSAQCAVSVLDQVVSQACKSAHYEWRSFYDSIQRIANTVQLMGWELQLSKIIEPTNEGLSFIDLVLNVQSQITELQKLWQDHRQDGVLWNNLDRQLLTQVAAFFASLQVACICKLSESKSEPTLCNVLLAKSQLMAMCTPRVSDPAALVALKHSFRTAASNLWRLELVHRIACVLHPAFKHMRRLDVSDRERSETYSTVRNLLKQLDLQGQQQTSNNGQAADQAHNILRNTLESSKNGSDGNRADLKRKTSQRSDSSVTTTATKRQRTSAAAVVAANVSTMNSTPGMTIQSAEVSHFDFSELADFSLTASDGAGGMIAERDELDLYLEEKVIQQDMIEFSNVLVYWKNRRNVFPAMSQLAFWILALPPAAESEDWPKSSGPDSVVQRLLFQIVAQSNSAAISVD